MPPCQKRRHHGVVAMSRVWNLCGMRAKLWVKGCVNQPRGWSFIVFPQSVTKTDMFSRVEENEGVCVENWPE